MVRHSLTKTCSKCSETKPLEEFYANPMGRFGRHSQCRLCNNKLAKDRYCANSRAKGVAAAARARKKRREARVRKKRREAGIISPDYVKFAAQFPEQLARVTAILERSTPRQAERLCLQILYARADRWMRFRVSWKGDELLSQYLDAKKETH